VTGVGIDLLEVERLERALERRPRLAERLFTDAEREYAASRARPVMHLAARFCAKEAVAKALGLTAWSFRDVEVVATGARLHPATVALLAVGFVLLQALILALTSSFRARPDSSFGGLRSTDVPVSSATSKMDVPRASWLSMSQRKASRPLATWSTQRRSGPCRHCGERRS
jgi:holo-[acyl-carrier-protein] synthase